MNIKELEKIMIDKVDGFEPVIVEFKNIETEEIIEKFMMRKVGEFIQVFGATQKVLDIINLTDDELVHYITEWTRACAKTLPKQNYHSSNQSMKEETEK